MDPFQKGIVAHMDLLSFEVGDTVLFVADPVHNIEVGEVEQGCLRDTTGYFRCQVDELEQNIRSSSASW
jgi:hypothetical protein